MSWGFVVRGFQFRFLILQIWEGGFDPFLDNLTFLGGLNVNETMQRLCIDVVESLICN